MNTSTFFPTLKKLIKRASSLLMLFQRTPAAQILVPAEFNLASSAAFLGTAEFAIATVAGLGAYDSVAGATTLTQVAGSLNGVVGQPFSVTFQVTGSESAPQSWSVAPSTPLPNGLSLPGGGGEFNSITGTPTAAGNSNVTLRAWEGASLNGNVVQKNIIISISAPAVATIITSPSSVTINRDQSTTLTVVAAGDSPLTYQWYQGTSGDTSTPLADTNSASYTTPVLTSTTSYWVKVTNPLNTTGASSTTAIVTVRQPAAITTQPVSPSITTGQTAFLSVTATGTGPLTYQWYQGNNPSETTPVGTNSPNFTTPSLLATTSYWVKVTNAANPNGAKSDTATVTVTEASEPGIFTASPLPAARTNIEYNTTLVAFGGRKPYAWSITDGNLPDGLVLSEIGVISGTSGAVGIGTFTVQVMDLDGKTDSRVFDLNISDLDVATTTLPTAVKSTAYSASLSAIGGAEPYTWSIQGGTLPAGITLSDAGLLSGTPTAAGDAAIIVRVTDASSFGVSKALLLPVSATLIKPVLNPITFPAVTVGTDFTHTVTAQNYPKSFAITGLPKGLKFTATTGVITGRPDVSGVFNVQVRAINAAGASLVVTSRLTVKALPKNLVGTFGGILTRSSTTNRSLGGQIHLSVTTNGTYTLKVTGALPNTTQALGGSAGSSATGRLAATAPQITTTVAGAAVSLSIDPANGNLSGSVGAASISGHRSAWNATTQPAEDLAGYYSMALDLAVPTNAIGIPQGSSYATFTVSPGGTLTIAGKTADGENITTASFLSSDADFWVYTPLYKNAGTLLGSLKITPDAQSEFVGNAISGTPTWFKPTIPSRTYGSTFGPLNLKAEGGYLAPSSKGNIILGLPETGTVQLRFTDGGLANSATDPDMDFTYTDDNKVVLPTALNSNRGKVTITVNSNTGAVAGKFTLVEMSPAFTRANIAFQGQVVRHADGQIKAVGYFLLPQAPTGIQKPADTAILSGGVHLTQPEL